MSNNKKRAVWFIAIIIITNVLTFYGSKLISLSIPNGDVLVKRDEYNNVIEFEKLFVVKDLLHKYYNGKIDDDVLEGGAIKGMTSALKDPYTIYMNKVEYKKFNEEIEGSYSGIGLGLRAEDGKIYVDYIYDGSPVKSSSVTVNDRIMKVDGHEVSGKDLDKAVSLMRGPEGSEVTITFYRSNIGMFDKKFKRRKIQSVTVESEMLKNDIGLIKVSMFDENTAANFKKKLNNLRREGMKGIIIDLRDNPGGVVDECVDMVSNFVPKGKIILSSIDKYKKETQYISKGGNFIGLPLVILVNSNSASASEIFAGAVRDYKIGTLVGEKTFGKGIVQITLDSKKMGLGDGTALKVTVSKYYTPSGENIQGKGIKPDIEVTYPQDLLKKTYNRDVDPQFRKAVEIINNAE